MLSANQFKVAMKRSMPKWLFDRIQNARTKNYRPPPEIAQWEEEHARLNSGLAADQFVFRPGIQFNVDPRAREGFIWFCYQSPEMVHEYDFFQKFREGKKAFLDLGACHGVYSLAFTHGRPDATALAVDASPAAFEVLAENARRNPGLKIQTRNVAVGDAPGKIVMRKNWYHLEAIPADTATAEDVTVSVATVDDIVAETGFTPDLIKIDVEGYELFVVRGARKFLSAHRVPLLLEIHPDLIHGLRYKAKTLISELQELGYMFFEAKITARPISPRELCDKIHVNWVACQPTNVR